MQHVIGLIDCDSFFASCEQANNPCLWGKPVCVLSKIDNGGIVLARTKEVKSLGIKMCDPYFKIKGKYPSVVFVASKMSLYKDMSNKVMNIIKQFSPDVEVASIDEAYIDLTGLDKVYKKSYRKIAQDIRNQIFKQLKINVSIGLSGSKLLAKLASEQAKNVGGVFEILPHNTEKQIGKLAIGEVCGIGKKHQMRLKMAGVFTISDFLNQPDSWIKKSLGICGLDLKHSLQGVYTEPVDKNPKPPKSIQSTSTLEKFTNNKTDLHFALNYHIHQACRKLRLWNGYASVVSVMLKLKNFDVVYTHQKLLLNTNSEQDMMIVASLLLDKLYNEKMIYRSCGFGIDDIYYEDIKQTTLFEKIEIKDDKLSRVIDDLENKFGKNIIKTGWV